MTFISRTSGRCVAQVRPPTSRAVLIYQRARGHTVATVQLAIGQTGHVT